MLLRNCPERFLPRDPSHARRRMRYLRRTRVLLVGVVALAACRDDRDVSRLTEAPASRHDVLTSTESKNWNRFEADVVTTSEGRPLLGSKQKVLTSGFSYRLIKYRDTQSQWVTEEQFDDFIPHVKGARHVGPPRLARIVMAAGAAPQFYDEFGRHMVVPSAPVFLPRPSVGPIKTQAPTLPLITPKAGGVRASASDTASDWIERFVVTPARAQRVRSRLLAQRGAPATGLPGHSRFSSHRGSLESEEELNDSRGTVDVVRLKEAGKVIQENVRDYEQQTDGTWVLKSERLRRFASNGNASSSVLLTTYRNIRILEAR